MEEEEDEEAEAEEEEDEGKVQVGAVPRVPGRYIFLFFHGHLVNYLFIEFCLFRDSTGWSKTLG